MISNEMIHIRCGSKNVLDQNRKFFLILSTTVNDRRCSFEDIMTPRLYRVIFDVPRYVLPTTRTTLRFSIAHKH